MLLTMAFHEQFHIIGWQHTFQGWLSKLRGKAVSEIRKIKLPSFSTTWSAQTILYLWNYTQSLWAHRNQVVHGKNDQEIVVRILMKLDAYNTTIGLQHYACNSYWTCRRDLVAAARITDGNPVTAIAHWLLSRTER